MNSNETYMTLTLNKAWTHQLRTYPNPAVGCLVLSDGEIVAVEAHQKAGTSHAEVLALISAYETISNKKIEFDRFDAHKAHEFLFALPQGFFAECTVFVTLEPCSHVGQTPICNHTKSNKVEEHLENSTLQKHDNMPHFSHKLCFNVKMVLSERWSER